jgi:hypothetical protein
MDRAVSGLATTLPQVTGRPSGRPFAYPDMFISIATPPDHPRVGDDAVC